MPNWVTPCAGCKCEFRAIGGDGPRPAKVLIVLERPGQDENRNGRVACGNTGQELDELYLRLAGLDRSEVRVCNTVLCGEKNNKAPADKEIAQCAPYHLPDEIERTNPEVILLCGSTPCSLVPGIRLDYMHGIPQHTSKVGTLFGWPGTIIPLYHPAIGLHESRWMTICLEDWKMVGEYLNFGDDGDPAPEPTQYREYHDGGWPWLIGGPYPVGVDTESHGGRPWSVQVSSAPGTGVLIRTDDARGMEWLRAGMLGEEIVLHNAAYDLEVLRQLDIPVRSYRDTMQEAFHLGNLPQGLKALAYRLFRHTMTSYEETVRPASIHKLQEWMTEAYAVALADLTVVTPQIGKKGQPIKDKVEKSGLESLLTRLLRLTDAASDYNPWGSDKEPRLDAFWNDPANEWMTAHVEARCGRYPILGIGNCTMQDAVQYAVGDADWTGRVAVELARRREGAFQIYKGDRDV